MKIMAAHLRICNTLLSGSHWSSELFFLWRNYCFILLYLLVSWPLYCFTDSSHKVSLIQRLLLLLLRHQFLLSRLHHSFIFRLLLNIWSLLNFSLHQYILRRPLNLLFLKCPIELRLLIIVSLLNSILIITCFCRSVTNTRHLWWFLHRFARLCLASNVWLCEEDILRDQCFTREVCLSYDIKSFRYSLCLKWLCHLGGLWRWLWLWHQLLLQRYTWNFNFVF